MRYTAVVFLLVLAGCSASGGPTTTSTEPAEPTATTSITTTETQPTITAGTGSTSTTVPPPTTTTTLAPLQGLGYEEIATIGFPIDMVSIPGSPLAILAFKEGTLRLFSDAEIHDATLLDIRDQVRNSGEQGLLGIAVHPIETGRLFVHYSANDGDTVVSEFLMADEGLDPDGERVLLRLDQPASNHNGGMIQFGPDGRLYLGLGDGGGANDRFGNGQNTDSLLAGLVAIDVESGESELFSYGLRNPWRFWIEGEDIYIADVGQNRREEVSVSALRAGLNYGWPIMEGFDCFRPSSGCDTTGLVLPVLEVSHGDAGTCSITGGLVYRGSAIPEIHGHYFYSDYCGGYLRSFRMADGQATDLSDWTEQVGRAGNVVGFGLDADGEMYVMTIDRVLKVVPVRG